MTEVINFSTCELDQEIDTLQIIPTHPDYIIIGTYSLQQTAQKEDLGDTSSKSLALRNGSLQILPFEINSNPPTIDEVVELSRKDFSCAIVDIHFHPADNTLLGAATSAGELRFFRVIRDHNRPTKQSGFQIIELGIIALYSLDEVDTLPLVTQFVWLPDLYEADSDSQDNGNHFVLAACDSTGNSQLVRVMIPDVHTLNDERLDTPSWPLYLTSEVIDIHKQSHNLEAWCVSTINIGINDDSSINNQLFLSGGDDNTLIVSRYDILTNEPLTDSTPFKIFTDRTTHTAGVVAILPLPFVSDPTIIPVLTGSYDETIHLYHLSKLGSTLTHFSAFTLPGGGGVWKIALLDHYFIVSDNITHYVLLISAMHAGARIVRLSHSTIRIEEKEHRQEWEWKVEAMFSAGHTSMVYACVAKEVQGKWMIVSTSFYDKKICRWEWADEVKEKER